MSAKYSTSKPKDYRRVRPEVVITVILIVVAALVLSYIYWDSRRDNQVVDNSQNKAVLGVYEGVTEPFKTMYEEKFSLDIPEDWAKINNPEIRVNGKRFYPIRYQGTSGYNIGRRLDVYIDNIPVDMEVNKILVVKILEGKILLPQALSPQCTNFTDFPPENKGEPFDSSWEGHNFICETVYQDNTIAAVHTDYNEGLPLSSGDKQHTVMLVYTDHGGRTNNDLFSDIVSTFKLR